ncbi:MAG TPA: L-histidine N(alpha)-methyltransferase [Bryobacteraceae bacterium]|nr:L-histidine N(alpha)-methyltransferase [Bryobacteraceae bacterium]
MQAHVAPVESTSEFAFDVRQGLDRAGQKELPSKYLYDEVGSRLFEAICELPEYGLTRADERILQNHAADIVKSIPGPLIVAELGSGSGRKTRWILEAITRHRRTSYYPIEISGAALAMCERELSDLDSVSIIGCEQEYLDGLRKVASQRRSKEQILVLFLGSTIGNFDYPANYNFLREVRQILTPGDALLLGTDLEKPTAQLMAAYDDPLGVTAAFNRNLLARINRELDGDFLLKNFRHVARFNSRTHSIEMHLQSVKQQVVSVAKIGLAVAFRRGETIWTESSHKYSPSEVVCMAGQTGFRAEAQWIDREWPFAESLLIAE